MDMDDDFFKGVVAHARSTEGYTMAIKFRSVSDGKILRRFTGRASAAGYSLKTRSSLLFQKGIQKNCV